MLRFARILALYVILMLAICVSMADTLEGDEPATVYLPSVSQTGPAGGTGEWNMVAGNPERTSWVPEQVTGNLQVAWYRPIEAYIPQNSQIIAANGLLYIATARGLYALDAASGAVAWRFDTELPLGNSPTVVNGVVYVGGHDRKLHALNALNGTHLWSFNGAKAGYDTNPLVVNGKVFAGNRDGKMYAIGAHGSPQQGQLIWQYQTGGAIHLSAAFHNGVVYFAANDNFAYALNANTGALVWRSGKLPGMQYQSFWPVIFHDKVIFATAFGYRGGDPGLNSVDVPGGGSYPSYREMQLDDLFQGAPEGTIIGPEVAAQPWANGYPVISASRITEYLEDNPTPDPHKYKPWRRVFVVLNQSDGSEFTFDSDQDGYPEYIPATWWGTNSGNVYPPVVGQDGILYFNNLWRCCSDAKGKVMGWNIDSPGLLSVGGAMGAVAEPQAIAMGGNVIYRNLCCDRVGDWFDSTNPPPGGNGGLWSYNLSELAPNYDSTWIILPGWPRLKGYYLGVTSSVNAAYHNHGVQNPIIPYQGKLYAHRSNAIIAFGPTAGSGALPLLQINEVEDNISTPSLTELRNRLATEIQNIVNAGHLRPGYYTHSQFLYPGLNSYFENPGDTLYALTLAYPHLPSQLQGQVRTYLQNEFQTFFDDEMYARIGWNSGAARESMVLPPEVQADLANFPPMLGPGGGWSWSYPQHNFYAMWKYAEIFPQAALQAYNLAKSKLQVPVPTLPINDYFQEQPYELNGWITGYMGFLELQELAGMQGQDAQLRTQVNNELNRLLQLRVSIFSKDSYWTTDLRFYKKHLDVSRNFIFLVPELADYLAQQIPDQVQQAVDEYEYIAPYWFVSRYDATIGEGVMANLYNYHGLFLAKAYILNQSRQELTRYLDVPAFKQGDLFHIMNLVAAIEAPDIPGSVTETKDCGD
jgi:hypothetical protein